MREDFYSTDAELGTGGGWSVLAGIIIAGFLVTLGVLALTRIGVASVVSKGAPTVIATNAEPVVDPSTIILQAFLTPALEPGKLPLQWADPRASMGCGPRSQVNVDLEPLRPGSAVPVVPFVVDWESHGCRPFGLDGPRFDGRVRLTVFHEDWGFSAMVEPAGMRVTMNDGRMVRVRRGGAWVQSVPAKL